MVGVSKASVLLSAIKPFQLVPCLALSTSRVKLSVGPLPPPAPILRALLESGRWEV